MTDVSSPPEYASTMRPTAIAAPGSTRPRGNQRRGSPRTRPRLVPEELAHPDDTGIVGEARLGPRLHRPGLREPPGGRERGRQPDGDRRRVGRARGRDSILVDRVRVSPELLETDAVVEAEAGIVRGECDRPPVFLVGLARSPLP